MALATPSTPPPSEEWVSRRLRLPNDTLWQSLVDGLLSKLMDDWYYYQSPDGIRGKISDTGTSPGETTKTFVWLATV